MVFFVIGGYKEDESFSHVAYVANHLSLMLPEFSYETIAVEFDEWQVWLADINGKNNWHHLQSPIIWKHVGYGHGRDVYIGGITEFWEYVYDYYNISSFLTEEELKKLVKDFAQFDRYQ